MSLNAKRIIVAVLSFLFLITLIVVAWVEGLKKRAGAEPVPVTTNPATTAPTRRRQPSPPNGTTAAMPG